MNYIFPEKLLKFPVKLDKLHVIFVVFVVFVRCEMGSHWRSGGLDRMESSDPLWLPRFFFFQALISLLFNIYIIVFIYP